MLTWENLSSFKSAADFAFFLEKINDELTITIEKSAKDTGMWLFEKKKAIYLWYLIFFLCNSKQETEEEQWSG